MRIVASTMAVLMASSVAFGQDTLKVMTYNLLNYTDASRDQYYRTVFRRVKPDVLVVEEMTSQTIVDNFYDNVVNPVFPGQFAKGTYINGYDTDNVMYYRPSKST